ncbi:fe-S cluster assembly factor HCF101 [Populus alba x Populus x berolinensis]|uniref:Fe-S cluster assembly factor HCF101, chloroplastic n=1 Tax=Populus alba x Populus x berolinensis TaxID=444605 RepID=A0AAD6LBS3_9ROSI|nr:fe-S cluster assembly factor HCF101 [Populus alba x Populus x berolinensis]
MSLKSSMLFISIHPSASLSHENVRLKTPTHFLLSATRITSFSLPPFQSSLLKMQLLYAPTCHNLSLRSLHTRPKEGLFSSLEKWIHLSVNNQPCKLPPRKCFYLKKTRALNSSVQAGGSAVSTRNAESDVLKALSQIIDPDFGTDIVSCGFVKDLNIDEAQGEVSFRLELTTPACPVKDMFEQKANEVVALLPWVKNVKVTMSAQPARPVYAGQLPQGLQTISNIIAVSSCKGGVGKSTVAVNLAYTLAGMGARVGIFDADVYGPSLPTMVSPENRLLEMNPEKRTIIPTEYLGVKLVSFGFAGQGRAIMRGPMVSGVIDQLLTTTEWGELDYLVIDMPPGTGDIQLTLCQVVPLTAAVIVTTPQKLAFIDVAKGVRMFSKLKVVQQFGIPHLFDLPIRPTLSASGDGGMPEVAADPQGEVAKIFQNLGVCVVQQCAKIRQQVSTAVTYDKSIKTIKVRVPDSEEEFLLHPATVRRNDRSAQSVDEWTGEQKLQYADVPEDIEPEEIRPMGNYAVQITWPDGFSQIAPYDQLQTMERLVDVPEPAPIGRLYEPEKIERKKKKKKKKTAPQIFPNSVTLSVRVRKILPSVFVIVLTLDFTPLTGHAALTTTPSRSLLSSALNKPLVFRHHAASPSNRTLPGGVTCETMSTSTGTVFPTLRSVTIPYTDLKNKDADLSAKIEEGFGPNGLGILSISDVPGFSSLRQNLLHLSPRLANLPQKVKDELEDPHSRYNFGWSHGKEKLESGKPDLLKGSFYANPILDVPTTDMCLKQRYPSYCSSNIWPGNALPELETGKFEINTLILMLQILSIKYF